jgi:hypothetical protein
MKAILITLALVALLITAGCTKIGDTFGSDTTEDETTEELANDLSEAENLDLELGDIDDFNLDELDF